MQTGQNPMSGMLWNGELARLWLPSRRCTVSIAQQQTIALHSCRKAETNGRMNMLLGRSLQCAAYCKLLLAYLHSIILYNERHQPKVQVGLILLGGCNAAVRPSSVKGASCGKQNALHGAVSLRLGRGSGSCKAGKARGSCFATLPM